MSNFLVGWEGGRLQWLQVVKGVLQSCSLIGFWLLSSLRRGLDGHDEVSLIVDPAAAAAAAVG